MADSTTPIAIPYPQASDLHLRITIGACKLTIRPGSSQGWVTGNYTDESGALPIRISAEDGMVHIDQKRNVAHVFGLFSKSSPELQLDLGTDQPYALTIESGAGESDCSLGSLPLRRLSIRQGAVSSKLNFSVPNPQQMTLLEMSSGAAEMKLLELANSNASVMTLQGGAAAYTFDFGGTLQRDSEVKLSTGMSTVSIIVPHTTAAKVAFDSFLGRLDIGDGFTKQAGAYWTRAAIDGKSPVLTIRATIGLGNLELRGSESVPATTDSSAPMGVF